MPMNSTNEPYILGGGGGGLKVLLEIQDQNVLQVIFYHIEIVMEIELVYHVDSGPNSLSCNL